MALETGTYISDLVATNPLSSDLKSEGDDHLRLIKAILLASFPTINGALTKSLTDLNYAGWQAKVTFYTATGSIPTTDIGRISVANSATDITLTLPLLSSVIAGDTLTFTNINNGVVTIQRSGTDAIYAQGKQAASSVKLSRGDSVTLTSAGSWVMVACNTGIGTGGQEWTDVAASRSASTTYTNTTGKPIFVSVSLITSSACTIRAVINGSTILNGSSYGGSSGVNSISFIVPHLGTYLVENNTGTSVITRWAELRD